MSLPRRAFLSTAAATFTATAGRAANNQHPPAPAAPIFGASLPLSGAIALTGDECLRGIQLAAATLPKPINLLTADATDQSNAAAAVNSLINNGHANILLGSGASELSYPGSAAAELAQIPYIELNAPADGITTRGFKYLLRTGPTTTMIAELAVRTLQTRFPGKKIGLLFSTSATGGAIASAVLTALTAAKTPPTLVTGYAEDMTDLYDPVGRLKRADVEVLLHAAGPIDVLALFGALQERDWRPYAILGCGAGYLLRETAAALGPDFDNTLVIGAPFSAPAFDAAYMARFGTPPRSPDSLSAYVGAGLVFNTNPNKLLDTLRKTNIPTGGLTNGWGVAFDHNGQNTRCFVRLQEWRDGRLS